MRANFPELVYISDKVKCFIGLRSGILDFLACTDAKILCISSIENYCADLKIIFPESNAHTLYFLGWIIRDISNAINAKLSINGSNLLSMNFAFNFKHKYLSNDDIFCLEDDLMKAILKYINLE